MKKGRGGDPTVDRAAMKALVTVYGPREAARVSGLPVGTVMSWCARYKWKKALFKPRVGTTPVSGKDAGDLLKESLEKSRENSTMHLAKYTERAAKKAAEHKDPLEVARKVRDVAGVYNTLWPAEEESQLIEGAILLGIKKPTINVEEIEAAREVDGVRAELADQGQAGD